MQKRGVLDIKTYANITDQRRARTPHGAYLELACLALHKHRLLKERQGFEARNAEIEARVREMDRKAGVLRSFVEDPRSFAVEPPQSPNLAASQPVTKVERKPGGPTIREQEFRY